MAAEVVAVEAVAAEPVVAAVAVVVRLVAEMVRLVAAEAVPAAVTRPFLDTELKGGTDK